MNYARLKQDERLVFAHQAIQISINDDELRVLLMKYGFDKARLNAGLALQEFAQQHTSKRITEFGKSIDSTAVFRASYQEARSTYGQIRRVIRAALNTDDRGVFTQLRMHERISKRIDGFIAQAHHFYAEALLLPELLQVIARFNITPEVLNAGLREIDAVNEVRMQQKHQKGLAQVATQQRKAAMAELDVWMKEFLVIVRLATAGDPQQLEKLGMVVK